MNNTDIIQRPEMQIQPSITPTEMLQAIVKGGITPENIMVFEKALDITFRMETRDAEKRFNADFVKFQSEMPVIVASSVIPNRGKYERYEDIIDKDGVGALLQKHGFSVSFSQPPEMPAGKIVVICHLSHIGGHSRPSSCAVRVKRADNETQSDTMAMTTAKRNALIQALNLIIRQDVLDNEHDAAIEGDPYAKVTQEQAEELERRVSETSSNINSFMRLAGAASFANILAKDYDMLDRLLREKEAKGR